MSSWDGSEWEFRTRLRNHSPVRKRRYLPVVAKRLDRRVNPVLALSVHCPKGGRVSMDVCVECAEGGRLRAHGRGKPIVLECTQQRMPEVVPQAGLPGASASASVSELLPAGGLCLTPGLGLAEVATLFRARGLIGAPVVDGARRPVGVLSCADIVRARSANSGQEALTVADAMRPVTRTLPTTAGVSEALSLVWEQRQDNLVLTTPQGEVAGFVTEFELLDRLAGGPVEAPLAGARGPTRHADRIG